MIQGTLQRLASGNLPQKLTGVARKVRDRRHWKAVEGGNLKDTVGTRAAYVQTPAKAWSQSNYWRAWAQPRAGNPQLPRSRRGRSAIATARAPPLPAQRAASGCGPRGARPDCEEGVEPTYPAPGSKERERADAHHAKQTLLYLRLISHHEALTFKVLVPQSRATGSLTATAMSRLPSAAGLPHACKEDGGPPGSPCGTSGRGFEHAEAGAALRACAPAPGSHGSRSPALALRKLGDKVQQGVRPC
ncbi:uncharacterized protein [Equus przewalskii]|uniref:Uncharacterized protein n=1 Tax=Equus przewalskii TaxID=9798 RepID=A0ABM4L547_EQUPR